MSNAAREAHPGRSPRSIEGEFRVVQADFTKIDGAARPCRRRALLDERAKIEPARWQPHDGELQPADIEPVDDDRVSARELRNAVIHAYLGGTYSREVPLLQGDISERQPGQEIAIELGNREV